MKQRTITGLAIIAMLVLVMFARTLSIYIFDAFVLALAIVASYEMSNLLTKQGLYNNKYFAMMYPILAYALYMIGVLCKLKIYIVVVMQIGLIVILVGALALLNLFATKATKNEIATRKLKLKVENFSIFKSVHTMFSYLYPTLLMLFLVLINNITNMQHIFIEAVEYLDKISLFAILITLIIPIFTDTFAYLTGSLFKGPKLCPKVSPNKTISGAIGGLIWGTASAVGLYYIFAAFPEFLTAFEFLGFKFWHFIILGAVGAIVSQIGDIFESYLKRKANTKDSGSLLAGHGGILDRMDSHIVCAPVVFIFFVILLL